MKDEILQDHDNLEKAFNTYGEDSESIETEEDNLGSDISRLLKSNFFNKNQLQNDVAEQDLDLNTENIESEVIAKLDGRSRYVESAAAEQVGAEFTEAKTEDGEDAPATESATSESETKSDTVPATSV